VRSCGESERAKTMPRRDHIFISYSRRDAKWREKLETHLKPRLRNAKIGTWSDRQIPAGTDWEQELQTAMQTAAVAVLLVTPEYLASDFVVDTEIPALIAAAEANELTLLWIAVKASAHYEMPFARFQALVPPDRPIVSMHHAHADRQWDQIALKIKQAWYERCAPSTAAVQPGPLRGDQEISLQHGAGPFPTEQFSQLQQDQEASRATPLKSAAVEAAGDLQLGQDTGDPVLRRRVHAVIGGYLRGYATRRNPATGRHVVVATRTSMRNGWAETVHVLEEFGGTFRQIWSSADLNSPQILEFDDINGDGAVELVFKERLGGTLLWWECLSVLFPMRNLLVQISEQRARDPSLPPAKEVSLTPENLDESLLRTVEAAAQRHGFLQGHDNFDLNAPEYATYRWHLDCEHDTADGAPIVWFPGRPRLCGSVTAHLNADGMEWIGEFKGALYAYEPERDRFFVVYSSADIYNWPKALALGNGVLWFSCHMDNAVYSYERSSNRLRRHPLEAAEWGVELLEISDDGEWLILTALPTEEGVSVETRRVRTAELLQS
jgi:hypothetical protein